MPKISFLSFLALPLSILGLLSHTASSAEPSVRIELIGVGQFAGTELDLSGHNTKLRNGEPQNRLGGFSALEYTGTGSRYVALADRGPDDGAVAYLCRFQVIDVNINLDSESTVDLNLVESVMLRDRRGRSYVGDATAMTPRRKHGGRLDPEGFRFAPNGRDYFVSDEYGPSLFRFSSKNHVMREYDLPMHLSVANPANNKLEENRINQRGRSGNKGLEGLAISPDGRTLYGIMQHVLLQDGERLPDGKITGTNCRLVEVDIKSGAVREFVYPLDQPTNGLNEILAIGDGQFLVIERDSLIGEAAAFKKIMKIDINGATDVQLVEKLPTGSLPDEIVPVRKEIFIDFLSPEFSLPPEQIPEKLEGLTFGQPLADGRKTLLVSSDNDFEAAWPSFVYVFALSNAADLQTVRVSQSEK